ncbi:MAG: hypothetical protein AAF721_20955 [Myxococcota bacterium]
MKRLIVVAAVLLAALLSWLLLSKPSVEPDTTGSVKQAAADPQGRSTKSQRRPSGASKPDAKEVAGTKKRTVTKAERNEIRRRIVEGIEARKQAARDDKEPAPADPARAPEEERSGEDGVTDRTGGELSAFVATVNEDFMPLADECYEAARQDDPELRGMLDLNVTMLADEDIGGIVDTVELGRENEMNNAQMTECIRESMLSTVFPDPRETGHAEVRLTLRFDDEE